MQGMQQVDTWNLLTVVPIFQANAGASSNPADPYFITGGFNPNGWFYEVSQGGTPTAFRQENFGASTQ
jgi:hypothetical protein